MSAYALVFSESTSIENPYAGLFAENFNVRIGFISCGDIIILLIILLFVLRSREKVIKDKIVLIISFSIEY